MSDGALTYFLATNLRPRAPAISSWLPERVRLTLFLASSFGTLTGRSHTLERANTAKPRMPSTNTEGCDEISCPSPLVVLVLPFFGHTTCQLLPVLSWTHTKVQSSS